MFSQNVCFGFICALFFVYVLVLNDAEMPVEIRWKFQSEDPREASLTKIHSSDVFDQCLLKVYDPMYKEIKKFVWRKDPLRFCNRNYIPPTQLVNAVVEVHPLRAHEFESCSASCLQYVSSTVTKVAKWLDFLPNSSIKVECDFMWTKCFKNSRKKDEFLHWQIYEEKKEVLPVLSAKPPVFQPNVYVIVVDSVSSTQALRSLPKTIDFLKKKMSGVFFHHLNKVGDNSCPNGFAMTLGWRISESIRNVTGAENLPPQYDHDIICTKGRDDDPVIFKEYERQGYKTAHVEDWQGGDIFTYPDCKGFQKQPTTHSFRPLIAAVDVRSLFRNYQRKNCIETAREALNYTGQFIKAYKGKPKFGFTWLATISHDDANQLYHEDDYFEAFFKEHEPFLRDSFVFFIGDHGIRFGPNLKTELGKRELNNPMLTVTVPQFLRKNEKFMMQLEENSMKLLTQYDIHATLVDLLKFAPQSNFTDFGFKTISDENPNNATSILRPLGDFGRRNCKNIPVPFQYCLCEYDMEEVRTPSLMTEIHEMAVSEINKILVHNNITDRCAQLSADKVLSLRAFAPEKATRLYEIIFSTKPGGGEFKTLVYKDDRTGGLKLQAEIERMNSYGNDAYCIKEEHPLLQLYCYCMTEPKP